MLSCMVALVPLVWAAARVPKATSIVESTTLAQNRRQPITSWSSLMPGLSSGCDFSGAFVICVLTPCWGGSHACGESCGCCGSWCVEISHQVVLLDCLVLIRCFQSWGDCFNPQPFKKSKPDSTESALLSSVIHDQAVRPGKFCGCRTSQSATP